MSHCFKKIVTYRRLTKKQRPRIDRFFASVRKFVFEGCEYDVGSVEFQLVQKKNKFWKSYKAGKQYNYVLSVNGQPLPVKAKFCLEYECETCGRTNVIRNNFRLADKLMKNTSKYCVHCLQKHYSSMRKARSDAMSGHKPVKGETFASKNVKARRLEFEEMPPEWKREYFRRNYTSAEFERMLSEFSVISINGHFVAGLDYEYVPYVMTFNENMFAPKIRIGGELQSVSKMECVCGVCGNPYSFHFKKKDTLVRKTKNICRGCMEYYLVNSAWPVRDTLNCNGGKVTYQSNVELGFLDFCAANGIEVVNGPVLEYEFGGMTRKYHVDFLVPCVNELVEIKAMHRFQRDDIRSGKFQAKCAAAEREVTAGRYSKFAVVYDYQMTDEWKRDFISRCKASRYNNQVEIQQKGKVKA